MCESLRVVQDILFLILYHSLIIFFWHIKSLSFASAVIYFFHFCFHLYFLLFCLLSLSLPPSLSLSLSLLLYTSSVQSVVPCQHVILHGDLKLWKCHYYNLDRYYILDVVVG